MINQKHLHEFERIYNETYSNIQDFVFFKCRNINDVNDIIQDIYYELFKAINSNKQIEDITKYLYGIAKNKIRKYYFKLSQFSKFHILDDEVEVIDDIDILDIIIKDSDIEKVWKFLEYKNRDVNQIFYLYYYKDLTIKEISIKLDKNESYVKNLLYRTLKELKNVLGKDDHHVFK